MEIARPTPMSDAALLGRLLRVAALRPRRRPPAVMILPNTGAGSLGDQAMLDVAVAEVRARGWQVVLPQAAARPHRLRQPCRALPLPEGRLGRSLRILAALAAVDGAALIAADVINDRYGSAGRLLKIVSATARSGRRAALFGFSLDEATGPVSTALLRALPPQVAACLRDPVSLGRYRDLTGRAGVPVADAAFLLRPETVSPQMRAARGRVRLWRAEGRTVMAVNAGGWTLAAMGGEGIAAHVRLLRGWLAADAARAVVLLPHDFRPGPHGDQGHAGEIHRGLAAAGFADRALSLVPPFDAWEVKDLVGSVDFVLSGRMHLAIASLGMGTPALCLPYLGKFEGLMALFGLEGMLVAPGEVPRTAAMLARLGAFEARVPALRRQIAAALPGVQALARRNFDWLGPAPEAAA